MMSKQLLTASALLALSLALGGCSFMSQQSAPIDNRVSKPGDRAGASVSSPVLGPYQHMSGKPGYYTVLPGDTVYAIARNRSVSPRDLIAWNRLDNPNAIEVGQVLLVSPPSGVATTSPVPNAQASVSPIASAPKPPTGVAPGMPSPSKPVVNAPKTDPAASIDWTWPSSGRIVTKFDGNRSKGVDIVGVDGSDIYAAADGVVMIAAEQRGYGNLVVLKHHNSVLSAYAHNRALLVKEGQNVKSGQVIAKMGNLDTDRVKLHFQIRVDTKPINPERYLPSR